MEYNLTDDRVFGKMYFGEVSDLIDKEKFNNLTQEINSSDGVILVYGFGAFLVEGIDLHIYYSSRCKEI